MKKIYAMAVLLLMTIGAYAQEGRNIYNKYSDTEGVSAVYISPAMFRLIGKLPEINVEVGDGTNMDLAPLVRTFTGFYMLDIENASINKELVKAVDSMVTKGRYEMLMEVKDDGETVRIYTAGNEKTIESIVFIASEADVTQFICLDGSMSRSEVEPLIAKAAASSM